MYNFSCGKSGCHVIYQESPTISTFDSDIVEHIILSIPHYGLKLEYDN